MSQNKRWSKEEEQVLLDCVRECNNVTIGLEKASKILSRSFKACQSRYNRIYENKKIKTTGKNRIYTRWNEEKDRYLLDYIGKHPNNIGLAFEHVANKYNTSFRAVESRYYQIRNNHSAVFTIIGKKTHSPNVKNIAYDSPVKAAKHSLWSKVKKLFNIK